MATLRIVNYADHISDDEWNFLEDRVGDSDLEWIFFNSSPINWLEKLVKKPKLARYRACIQATMSANRAEKALMITHLPRATCWAAIFAGFLTPQTPHMAFSFNFTHLPNGISRLLMTYAFKKVDRFAVFSKSEKSLYTEFFKLDPERIDVLPWAMETPKYAPDQPIVEGDYICAVGGEGRDYGSLAEAMRSLPNIPLVVVARPYSLKNICFPSNVKVFTDLPKEKFWNIVRFSRFCVIPLLENNTNCGHISIVGTMLHGKPIVATTSTGIEDYVIPDETALTSSAKDVGGLITNIRKLWSDSALCHKLGTTAHSIALEKHNLDHWVTYLKKYLRSISH